MHEETYDLSDAQRALFKRIFAYGRETVGDRADGSEQKWRVRWWSVLGILRALSSSPAAAAATLDTRAELIEDEPEAELDELARRIFDGDRRRERRGSRPAALGRARRVAPPSAAALQELSAGRAASCSARPTRSCSRRRSSSRSSSTTASTRSSSARTSRPPTTSRSTSARSCPRTSRSSPSPAAFPRPSASSACSSSATHKRACSSRPTASARASTSRSHFDAVVHYDLAWNPTRHEQREGRVDRYGQPSTDGPGRSPTSAATTPSTGSCSTCSCARTGRSTTGSGSPFPSRWTRARCSRRSSRASSCAAATSSSRCSSVPELAVRSATSSTTSGSGRRPREALADHLRPADDQRRRGRTRARGHARRDRLGRRCRALRHGRAPRRGRAPCRAHDPVAIDLRDVPGALRDVLGSPERRASGPASSCPSPTASSTSSRTHPLVEGLAAYVADTALDPLGESLAARCGAMRTDAVATRTTLLLVRIRFDVVTRRGDERASPARRGDAGCSLSRAHRASRDWLDGGRGRRRCSTPRPSATSTPEQAASLVSEVIDAYDALSPALERGRGGAGRCARSTHTSACAKARASRVFATRSSRSCPSTCSAPTSSSRGRRCESALAVRDDPHRGRAAAGRPAAACRRPRQGPRRPARRGLRLPPNEPLNEAIVRSWNRLVGAWASFQRGAREAARRRPRDDDHARALAAGPVRGARLRPPADANAVEIDGKIYPVSHAWDERADPPGRLQRVARPAHARASPAQPQSPHGPRPGAAQPLRGAAVGLRHERPAAAAAARQLVADPAGVRRVRPRGDDGRRGLRGLRRCSGWSATRRGSRARSRTSAGSSAGPGGG